MSGDRCKECGHFITAPGKKNTWTTKTNAQKWERPGGTGPLTQAYPPVTPRAKSLTRNRAEQSLMLGCAGVACTFCLVSPLPLLADFMIFVSASTFILSVALGKDNQEALFKLLDRNKDGLVNTDDLHDTIDDMRQRVDDLLNKSATPIHEPPPDIEYTNRGKTKPIAGPEPYIARSLIIRAETIDQPALIVELDVLCAFLRAAVGIGKWSRSYWTSKKRGDYKLSPDTWQAYFHFFSRRDVGVLWKMHPPAPDLPGIIGEFRQWATDQPETD